MTSSERIANKQKQADVRSHRDPGAAEGQHHEGTKRGDAGQIGGHAEQHAVRRGGNQVFFLDELHAVGQALQPAELAAHAGRPQAVLNPPGDFSLGPNENQRHVGKDAQNQHDVHHEPPETPAHGRADFQAQKVANVGNVSKEKIGMPGKLSANNGENGGENVPRSAREGIPLTQDWFELSQIANRDSRDPTAKNRAGCGTSETQPRFSQN